MNMFMNYYREYIVLTGGSSAGNYMHLQKTIGVLKALAEKEGLTYSEDVEKLAYTVEDVQKRMEEKKTEILKKSWAALYGSALFLHIKYFFM